MNTETIIEALDAPQLTNKRTIEDLFGDIDDIIDFDDNREYCNFNDANYINPFC